MISIDLIIIKDCIYSELDLYQTQRKIGDLATELSELMNINVCELDKRNSNQLNLRGDFCMVMLPGDFIESSYLKNAIKFFDVQDIVIQPLYTYSYDKSLRRIYKNIDISHDMAVFDVLAIRNYSSRHILSRSSDFDYFINNVFKYDEDMLWSYILWILTVKNQQLVCLPDTITFEKVVEGWATRDVKNMEIGDAVPIFCPSFDYHSVLMRQNINNVGVEERCDLLLVQESVSPSPETTTSVEKLEVPSLENKKPISNQTLRESIAENGVVQGVRLTSARLAKRTRDRMSRKLGVHDIIQQTIDDVKKTIEIK